ncbi:MAG TPA: N-acetylmuramoyl-L-alanine amidase [Vicinamibacterales bacterium]|nr:N-acetylmuramoyl-L-alanine amidase [Vicinamibacterales bacterium]
MRRILAAALALATTAPATAGQSPRNTGASSNVSMTRATVRSIHRTVMPDAVRIVIDIDTEVPFHDERIADPARVFIDLPDTRAIPSLVDQTLRFDGDADIVRQVRLGRHANNTTRVVLDAGGVKSYSVYPLYDPYRLVIDCIRESAPAKFAAAPPVIMAHPPATAWLRRPPSGTPRWAGAIAEARLAAAAAPVSPALELLAATPSPPGAPASSATTVTPPSPGVSMARQLGLGIQRIVIDPGHGGHDPGARGKGVTEAELVLDVALRLEKLLQKQPGVDVVLTRRTDDFIPLQERTAIANRENADLFLSIHANASPNPSARGVETYFLNFANNLSEAAVAQRENAASGQTMGALPDFVKAIALNNKLDESKDFARAIQRTMVDRLRASNKTVKDLGVKQAPFVVLIGAAMPSVLAEISFVTNAQEAKLLKSGAYRQRIAEALFNAIRRYQTSLKGVSTIAHQ